MATAYSPKTITDSLVLYVDAANVKSYPGTGNSVKDLSGYASNITFYNTPTITEKSFDFTSLNTDGLTIGSTDYEGLYDFTMECLFKVNGTHQNYDGTLMSSGDWNGVHWSFGLIQNNSGIRTRNPSITHTYSFNVGSWYHVVYRRFGSTINFFVNGVKSSNYSASTNIPLASGATNTAIGRETYAGGYFNLNGKIALSKIYNRSLSDSEVIVNFAAIRGRYNI